MGLTPDSGRRDARAQVLPGAHPLGEGGIPGRLLPPQQAGPGYPQPAQVPLTRSQGEQRAREIERFRDRQRDKEVFWNFWNTGATINQSLVRLSVIKDLSCISLMYNDKGRTDLGI